MDINNIIRIILKKNILLEQGFESGSKTLRASELLLNDWAH